MLHYFDLFPKDAANQEKFVQPPLGEAPSIHASALIMDSHIGSWTEIGANNTVIESVIGDYSYTAGDNSIIYTDVGKFCSIASHVRINPGNHPMERATQHHMTYRRKQYGFAETNDEEFFNWRREHRCVVGHDVWLGHGVIIMPGVEIGIGAVVGSGAVVTKNVAPYEIVVGVPAKPVRKRFADEVIEKLLASAWWDWDHATLKERLDDMRDIQKFVGLYGQ